MSPERKRPPADAEGAPEEAGEGYPSQGTHDPAPAQDSVGSPAPRLGRTFVAHLRLSQFTEGLLAAGMTEPAELLRGVLDRHEIDPRLVIELADGDRLKLVRDSGDSGDERAPWAIAVCGPNDVTKFVWPFGQEGRGLMTRPQSKSSPDDIGHRRLSVVPEPRDPAERSVWVCWRRHGEPSLIEKACASDVIGQNFALALEAMESFERATMGASYLSWLAIEWRSKDPDLCERLVLVDGPPDWLRAS